MLHCGFDMTIDKFYFGERFQQGTIPLIERIYPPLITTSGWPEIKLVIESEEITAKTNVYIPDKKEKTGEISMILGNNQWLNNYF